MSRNVNYTTTALAEAEDFIAQIQFSDQNENDDTRAKRSRVAVTGTIQNDVGDAPKRETLTFRLQNNPQPGDGAADGSDANSPLPGDDFTAAEKQAIADAYVAMYRVWRLNANNDV